MGKLIEGRQELVLEHALALAETEGYQWIKRADIAELAGVSVGSVSSAFGSLVELKREVLREAIRRENLSVLAQGLVDRHEIALGAPAALRKKAGLFIANV